MLPALTLLLPLALPGVDPDLRRFEFVEPHMGTRFQIIVYAVDEPIASRAVQAAFARIAHLDATMSDYRPTSELMRLCAQAGGPPVPVSADLFHVLDRSLTVSQLSEGAFDITIGPVVRLWRRCRRTQRLPEPEQLREALAKVGWRNIRLNRAKRTVQLLQPGMQLDLGGIAKGYAADEALATLKAHGIDRALVAAGGDIAVSGPPPGTDGWTIALTPLDDAERRQPQALRLRDAAVSTSGDTQQFVVIDGKRYSHIVDPRTGLGLTVRRLVTVVARSGIDADSLTKTVAILGAERGFRMVATQPGATARLVELDGDQVRVQVMKGFPRLHTFPEKPAE